MFKKISLTSFLPVLLLAVASSSFYSDAQRKSMPSIFDSDPYSMSPNSRHKPALQGFLVRLHADNGVSIIDTDGNIISRNFTPATDSQGKVSGDNWTTPVIDGIFCIERSKKISESQWKSSMTVYSSPTNPKPIPGLTDLYSANIINPNLFPICRRGERINFVDSKGNEKFTVMPIDGKEPHAVSPEIVNGLILVHVVYNVETQNYTRSDSSTGKSIIKSTEKWGAIDTNGKWVIYPEWSSISPQDDGTFMGWKDNKIYRIRTNGKAVRDTRFDNFSNLYRSPIQDKYIFETFLNGNEYDTNIYDLDMNYLTTINNADYIRVNHRNPNILAVRRNFYEGIPSNNPECDNLINLNLNNNTISDNYFYLSPLPDGNYLGCTRIPNSNNRHYWYVTANGNAVKLPDHCDFPLRHPIMALYYKTNIPYLIVDKTEAAPGYLCDFNGNKINDHLIDEYYNDEWEVEPVKSSYWRIHIYGVDY